MPIAVDVIHGNGPSNEMHRQLQPNKSKSTINIVFYYNQCKGSLGASAPFHIAQK